MSSLPDYSHRDCESIDASFFSGDVFHDPAALAEIEKYVQRWSREIKRIKAANFHSEDPTMIHRYREAVNALVF